MSLACALGNHSSCLGAIKTRVVSLEKPRDGGELRFHDNSRITPKEGAGTREDKSHERTTVLPIRILETFSVAIITRFRNTHTHTHSSRYVILALIATSRTTSYRVHSHARSFGTKFRGTYGRPPRSFPFQFAPSTRRVRRDGGRALRNFEGIPLEDLNNILRSIAAEDAIGIRV